MPGVRGLATQATGHHRGQAETEMNFELRLTLADGTDQVMNALQMINHWYSRLIVDK